MIVALPTVSRACWPEGTWRYQTRRDVGVMQGIELCPQHAALEAHGVDDRDLHLGRGGVLLDELQGEVGVAVRLVEAAPEVLHGSLTDKVVILQHSGDALAVDRG